MAEYGLGSRNRKHCQPLGALALGGRTAPGLLQQDGLPMGCERLPAVRAPRTVGSLQSRGCKQFCRGSRREPPDP